MTKAKLTSTDNVNDMAELVTASRFAIAAGCSRQAVSKAIQQGRLEGALVDTGNVNPKIDLDKGLRIWGVTERPSAAQMPEKPKKEPTPLEAAKKEVRRQVTYVEEEDVPDFYTSRARKEHYNAEIAKITAATQMEELVPAEQVKKESFQLGRSIREQLANLADRLSNELAGESDPAVIHRVLTTEHRQCLMEITKVA